jgi:hypothetical protein
MFSRVTFSSRLVWCGSLAVSTMQRIGSVFLISFRFPQKLGKPPALADGHEIASRWSPLPIQLRFDDKVLQDALCGDARGIGFNRRLAVRRLACILR